MPSSYKVLSVDGSPPNGRKQSFPRDQHNAVVTDVPEDGIPRAVARVAQTFLYGRHPLMDHDLHASLHHEHEDRWIGCANPAASTHHPRCYAQGTQTGSRPLQQLSRTISSPLLDLLAHLIRPDAEPPACTARGDTTLVRRPTLVSRVFASYLSQAGLDTSSSLRFFLLRSTIELFMRVSYGSLAECPKCPGSRESPAPTIRVNQRGRAVPEVSEFSEHSTLGCGGG